jgi:N6-adenosine-specific RNA methylase IME4
MSEGGKGAKISLPSRTSDRLGAFAGVSGRTLEKIKAVVEAAQSQPAEFGHLIEELDRHRGVDRAYRSLRRARDEARVLDLVPREGKFPTLVVDPGWEHDVDFLGRGAPQYAQMSREQILALPVPAWAEDNSHLYLWSTNAMLPFATTCMERWGFAHKSVLTWVKPPPFGLGVYFRGSTEHCLFGVRGTLMGRSTSTPTHFEASRGEHSEKPEKFYEIVRAMSFPPYGEAFQRTPRPDFTNLCVERPTVSKGDEAPRADYAADEAAKLQEDYPDLPDFLHRKLAVGAAP